MADVIEKVYYENCSHTLEFDGTTLEWVDPHAEFIVNEKAKNRGIVIKTPEKWYMRIWFLLTNPISYLFTGKIRY